MPYLTTRKKPKATTNPWFSRLLRHPARKRSGSILGHNTHTHTYLLTYFPRTHTGNLNKLNAYTIFRILAAGIVLMYKITYGVVDTEVLNKSNEESRRPAMCSVKQQASRLTWRQWCQLTNLNTFVNCFLGHVPICCPLTTCAQHYTKWCTISSATFKYTVYSYIPVYKAIRI